MDSLLVMFEACTDSPAYMRLDSEQEAAAAVLSIMGDIYIIQFGEFGDPPIPYLSKFSYFVSLYISLFYSFHCSITYRESGGKPVL